MSSKAQRFANANNKAAPPGSLEEADTAIYGPVAVPDSGRQVAKPVSIFEIYPDPMQPRRAVPSQARAVWNGQPDSVAAMLKAWVDLVEVERGSPFLLQDYLNRESDVERPDEIGPLEASLIDLINLTNDIHRNKLTNPVTIVRHENSFRLETGERRWLAFHLLYAIFQDDQWLKIPAHEIKEASVWRQASENSARTDLNAISRARQLALLLMDLYQQMGARFSGFAEMVQPGACDRRFYAQVADGEAFRVPRDKSTELLAAMGLKNPVQIRQYRALLRLPDELWVKADDENWDEHQIRDRAVTGVTLDRPPKEKSDYAILLDRVKRLMTSPPRDAQARTQALADIDRLQQMLNEIKTSLLT